MTPRTISALILGIVVLVCPFRAAGQPIVYERFEDGAAGSMRGGVAFVEDVVGWGGLAEPNHRSASFDGRAATCIDYGRETRVTAEDFTVEAFVKLAERSGYAAIAADWHEDGENRCWAFVLTPRGGLRFDVSPDGSFHGGNKLKTAPRLIEPNRWYHVAAVSQAGTSRIFVNGSKSPNWLGRYPAFFLKIKPT